MITAEPGTSIHYFCPNCFGAELKIYVPTIIDPTKTSGGKTAICSLCAWRGPTHELIGALSPDNVRFWTSERIGQALLTGLAKHAAGPVLQILTLIGIAPKIKGSPEEQESARAVRENIVKAVLAGAVTSAFEAAGEHSVPHFKRFDEENAERVEKIFTFDPSNIQ